MFNLFRKSIYDIDSPAFGLDLSDLTAKIVMLKQEGRYLGLSSFVNKKIPQGIIAGGEVQDAGKTANIIKKALESSKGKRLKTKYAVCSLPEEKAFIRVIQLPKMKKEEVAEAVKWEAENNIPMSLEEVYLDYQVIPPIYDHLDHFDVLIMAMPRKIIDSYTEVFKKAGIVPKVFEVESVAIIRSIIPKSFSLEPLLIIDLGQTRTSFIIFSGHTLRFTSSIEISGKVFTDAISRELKIDYKEAEKLKVSIGLSKKKKEGRVFESLIPALTDLTEQIRDYISFYQGHATHEHVKPGAKVGWLSKAILCGGGAGLKGLDSLLSLELKLPVEKANPWINILKPPLREVPELPYESSLAYSTALGLALRGIQQF